LLDQPNVTQHAARNALNAKPQTNKLRKKKGRRRATSEKRAGDWMCSQRRSILGLYQTLQHYQDKKEDLPDYLILIKDDTYYNLDVFPELMNQNYANASKPWAIAGCRMRLDEFPFQAPMSDFGLILSSGSLRNLLQPIHCQPEQETIYNVGEVNETEATSRCNTVKANHIEEGPLFQEGMTVADLMYAYVTQRPSLEPEHCRPSGLCELSDW
jgi:hypothetical protein